MAGAGEEFVGGGGAPGLGGVGMERGDGGGLRPAVQNGIEEGPGDFDAVAAGEERGVALERVEQQAFVGVGQDDVGEGLAVAEVHLGGARFGDGVGDLGFEAQVDAFLGLDADGEHVGGEGLVAAEAEHDVGRGLELDDDRAGAAGHGLAGAEVEGDALPAPVVDAQLERGEGGRLRIARDAFGGAVAVVLAAHDVFEADGADVAEDLGLFVADGVGVERSGRLHGHEREQLQQVVLEHVAQDAGLVVVAAAGADVDVLGHGDLDVGNIAPVPDGFEQRVGEP